MSYYIEKEVMADMWHVKDSNGEIISTWWLQADAKKEIDRLCKEEQWKASPQTSDTPSSS